MSRRKVEPVLVVIDEMEVGWRVTRPAFDDSPVGEWFETAAEALGAVKRWGTFQASGGRQTAQVIEWRPTSKVGARVATAMGGAR